MLAGGSYHVIWLFHRLSMEIAKLFLGSVTVDNFLNALLNTVVLNSAITSLSSLLSGSRQALSPGRRIYIRHRLGCRDLRRFGASRRGLRGAGGHLQRHRSFGVGDLIRACALAADDLAER